MIIVITASSVFFPHLNSVMRVIEEFTSAEGTEHWVHSIVTHIVGGDGGQRVPLGSIDAPLQSYSFLLEQQFLRLGKTTTVKIVFKGLLSIK